MTTVSTVDPATLRDRTPRPDPCSTCKGEVFWREAGKREVQCHGCAPCPLPPGHAYWYCAGSPAVTAFRERLKAERAAMRAKGGR